MSKFVAMRKVSSLIQKKGKVSEMKLPNDILFARHHFKDMQEDEIECSKGNINPMNSFEDILCAIFQNVSSKIHPCCSD
ncbi:hypothetical protein Y1Q_0008684 [Alligator mississippiensis]|uniref:Uncharacterized protein n=1 Tax=Alligator mississippiensis TaxID=8496 RepID=A0A151N9N5_ALLMI|nr:hypothetical protein Y1Q_0008684 [Alligator mississippiensis]